MTLWLREGRLQPDDLLADRPEGPWTSVREWLAGVQAGEGVSPDYFDARPGASHQAVSARAAVAQGPDIHHVLAGNPEFFKREKARFKKRAKKRVVILAAAAMGLMLLFVLILFLPFSPRAADRSVDRRSGLQVEDPARQLVAVADDDLEKASEFIAGRGSPKLAGVSRQDRGSAQKMAESAGIFGGSVKKFRDVQDGIEMEIVAAEIAIPRLRSGQDDQRTFRTRSPYLMINMRITNRDQQQSVEYQPQHSGEHAPELNWPGQSSPERPVVRKGFFIEGQQSGPVTLPPGGSIQEKFLFNVPPNSARSLTIVIPGECVGLKERFVFYLPSQEVAGFEKARGGTETPATDDDVPTEESGLGPLAP